MSVGRDLARGTEDIEDTKGDGRTPYWAMEPREVLAELDSEANGLSGPQAATRHEKGGPNRLESRKPEPFWHKLARHLNDVLIFVLLIAAALKAVMGDWVDFAVIMAVAVINTAIGLIQEGRAEKALDAIRGMLSTEAQVLRDGQWSKVDAEELVVGDVVRLRPGDRVPADMRILDATGLRAEESALTGESVPATKDVTAAETDAGLGDRSSMLFSSTIVVAGAATGVVVAIGKDTEIGRIQEMVAEVEAVETPLSRSLGKLGNAIVWGIIAVSVIMVIIGRAVHGMDANSLLSATIGVAVAAVPEGLPALVTITLALGVQQMARRKAITRRLPSVETLGSVTTICSDKTGTLTKNEMTAQFVRTAGRTITVEGTGYAPEGEFRENDVSVDPGELPDLQAVIEISALANDAEVRQDGEGHWTLIGEPTEGALHVLSRKAGFDGQGWRRLAEVPFDSEYKYMAVLVAEPGSESGSVDEHRILLKGAPDRVLTRCSSQLTADGRDEPIDVGLWTGVIDELGAKGLRVLATARGTAARGAERLGHDDLAQDLQMVGMIGIIDPPRPEAIEAIATCRSAGIRVKMITGDHAGTAVAIAQEMGIMDDPGARVLTGAELEKMSTEKLRAAAPEVDVYARTSPEHKIRIVKALQHHHEVVAMTGDGVNDAPALTQADVGVAMGIKGTEATKEAADVVLADDNFATIERAVEEGRRIYANIRKSVLFLLPTNGGQALVILVAVILGLSTPLKPVQVLWINMITSVTLSLALSGEPIEPGTMNKPPRDQRASILDGVALRRIVAVSALIGAAALFVFLWQKDHGASVDQAQTTAVTTLALAQLGYLFNCRFLERSSFSTKVLTGNRVLWWSAGALVVLQALFVYLPVLNTWFGSAPMTLAQWGWSFGLAVVLFLLVEMGKAIRFARSKNA
ncbi:potassium and/or sodium efflux P-type ATPase [Propionibacterium cyclohexanicum]|uniref:Potassium and/or sodium efflux P-type ATPase n=1 Tax=Propionibacterium cyclohexanicum TaxID=64702 RepID=A0A1H9Q1J0_9ACTN|nr:HAD-IC family P-type ATPase [Propionibacterium cyclohexanicum]SER53945.1 potassium and/or sodium efflux P-type ATPase [Propionibacterium cyclohexanicum]